MLKFFVFLFGVSSAVKFQVLDSSTYTYIRRNQLQNRVVSKNGVLEIPLNNVFCSEKCGGDTCSCQSNIDCQPGSTFLLSCPSQTIWSNNTLCCSGQCTDGTTNSNCGTCGTACAPPTSCVYFNNTVCV